MKSLIYVLLLGVLSCSKPVLVKNNDLEKENLKGNVKSIYTEEQYLKKKNGNPYKQSKRVKKEINFFNQYGLRTYSCIFFSGNTYKSKYYAEYKIDNLNRIKSKIEKYPFNSDMEMDFYYTKNYVSTAVRIDGELVGKRIEFYNNNRLIRTKQFIKNKKTNNYSLNHYITYLYNKKNQDSIITYYQFSKKNKAFVLQIQDKYLYDKNSNALINHKSYFLCDDFGDPANVIAIKRNNYTFKDYHYKYDKVGNWVEKVVLENNVLTKYTRKIKYFS
jgi:hypothetical protein